MRYKPIKEKILSKYDSLPKNQRAIADFFIDNFDRIPFLSVQDISKATDISVASIVRFAQSIDFKGYLELRDEIGKVLQNDIKSKEIFSLVDKKKLKDDALTHVANQDIKNINDTIHSIDRKSFDSAVKIIMNSTHVYTGGLGVSYLLSELLSYQLSQIAVCASALTHNYSTFMEQVLHLKKTDSIILLSFPPYSIETIETAKFASSKGIKVISITNKNASPITRYSDNVLIVSSENMLYTNSFAAISVLINALTTECALRMKSASKKMIKDLNEVVEQQKLVINK
jgi:DNA-binding MurR/RpiR family transcriptional regulator